MARTSQSSVRVTDAYLDQPSSKRDAPADDNLRLVIDGEDSESASIFAFGRAAKRRSSDAANGAADRTGERLRELSDEVSRIAATLARLSSDPGLSVVSVENGPAADTPALSSDTVRVVIRARRLRASYFPDGLFADPAWDMLLDLLDAEISQHRVSVSSLCGAAAVPPTTALRWLKTLVQQGLFIRRADPHDGRRVFVELAPETSRAMRRYFAEMGGAAVI